MNELFHRAYRAPPNHKSLLTNCLIENNSSEGFLMIMKVKFDIVEWFSRSQFPFRWGPCWNDVKFSHNMWKRVMLEIKILKGTEVYGWMCDWYSGFVAGFVGSGSGRWINRRSCTLVELKWHELLILKIKTFGKLGSTLASFKVSSSWLQNKPWKQNLLKLKNFSK